MKDHEAYIALPAKVAQWVLRLLDQNWQRYFAACAAWQEDSSKFLGHAKLPGYKDKQRGRNLLVHTFQALSAPALRLGAVAPSMLGITVATRQTNVQQVRIVPQIGFYVVEVIYKREPNQTVVDPALHAGIGSHGQGDDDIDAMRAFLFGDLQTASIFPYHRAADC